jgi:LmbE family N-acetylglucosaminyl deacetylase
VNMVVSAHPDDEIIGLGAQLPHLRNTIFITVTDGAPHDMEDARSHGFTTRGTYAEARRRELLEAFSMAGISAQYSCCLRFVDQEAGKCLIDITHILIDMFRRLRPRFVVTHPYEGGHPDHDATAFACHAARRLLVRDGVCPGQLVEFASYHMGRDSYVTGEFLPDSSRPVLTLCLSPEQQAFKRQLFSCFQTQLAVLRDFRLDVENFRIAPEYDFCSPPHDGPLYYENFSWGLDGKQWRQYARAALHHMKLEEEKC